MIELLILFAQTASGQFGDIDQNVQSVDLEVSQSETTSVNVSSTETSNIEAGESVTIDSNNVNNFQSLEIPARVDVLDIEVDANDTQKHLQIDVKERAQDWKESFDSLREQDPDRDIYAIVKGRSIERITDLEVTANGNILMMTSERIAGYPKHHAVRLEDLEFLGHRQSDRSRVRVKWGG